MSIQQRKSQWTRSEWAKCGIATVLLLITAATTIAADKPQPAKSQPTAQKISGEEIFRREWIPNDPRSHGGDGLGPVFNESSCVACHNQGGVGGGGPVGKNVSLVTSTLPALDQLRAAIQQQIQQMTVQQVQSGPTPAARQPRSTSQISQMKQALKQAESQHAISQKALIALHPGFRSSRTAVVHRFGTSELHENWRSNFKPGNTSAKFSEVESALSLSVPDAVPRAASVVQVANFQQPSANPFTAPAVSVPAISQPFPAIGKIQRRIQVLKQQARRDLRSATQVGSAVLQLSQRNTTALFGTGLIDSVPLAAIESAANRKYEEFPRITGRIHRLKNDKIGRFGWKAQESSLYDFTMTACAVEVGLHVPDHPQSLVPYKQDVKPTGYDLNKVEVNALVDYLRELPRPIQRGTAHPDVVSQLAEGEKLFASVGCAACHTKQMGEVNGLFSDLLIHDMGIGLGAVGSYGVPTPAPNPIVPLAKADGKNAKPKPVPPSSQEWRTPPLWGVRDSAPYLHDGRAATLEQAIAFHGGEAADVRLRYFMQSHERRQKIIAFLKSLTAPDNTTAQR